MEHFPFIKFYHGDVVSTNFSNESFNVIISQEVIEHIEQQEQYITELARLLCQNGYLIITTPNKFFFDRRNGGNWSSQPVEKVIGIKELKGLLMPYFTIIKLQTVIMAKGDHGVYRLLYSRIICYMLRKMGLFGFYEALLENAKLGVHIVLLAKKRH